jgi:hypothetical protein
MLDMSEVTYFKVRGDKRVAVCSWGGYRRWKVAMIQCGVVMKDTFLKLCG